LVFTYSKQTGFKRAQDLLPGCDFKAKVSADLGLQDFSAMTTNSVASGLEVGTG
jgi:hypothetical protein